MESTNILSSEIPKKMLTGCVKWFNNNLNYGFITVLTEGQYLNVDIFSHQSNIKTKNDCFRTLYTGECVQFELSKSDNEKHPFHAINISGFNGGMLHCENPNYRSTNNYRNDNQGSTRDGGRGHQGSTRGNGGHPGSTRGGSTSRGGGSSRGGGGGSTRGRSTSNNQNQNQNISATPNSS